jgi:hypothetical protein
MKFLGILSVAFGVIDPLLIRYFALLDAEEKWE